MSAAPVLLGLHILPLQAAVHPRHLSPQLSGIPSPTPVRVGSDIIGNIQ